ncbi:hypothetical protein MUK42_22650 [Musa troglodytarum]|uniref:Uncharacterized protein n=1 Tax=Musa troglodytarum TaxID=320322 RepID=A0A9E7JFS3_9LILI|nr:hypothetical protein MUK42_22650 [Musa troglodytarum]
MRAKLNHFIAAVEEEADAETQEEATKNEAEIQSELFHLSRSEGMASYFGSSEKSCVVFVARMCLRYCSKSPSMPDRHVGDLNISCSSFVTTLTAVAVMHLGSEAIGIQAFMVLVTVNLGIVPWSAAEASTNSFTVIPETTQTGSEDTEMQHAHCPCMRVELPFPNDVLCHFLGLSIRVDRNLQL